MDWQNERYVRLYTRDTIDDACLSWNAISLWRALLCKFDRAGLIQMNGHGWKGLSVLIRMPIGAIEPAVQELLNDGRIEMKKGYLIAPNFIAAQEAKQSHRQRQKESPARKREQVLALDCGHDGGVTKRDDMSQNVTDMSQNVTKTPDSVTRRHTPSHRVTPSLAEPSLARENNTLSKKIDGAENEKTQTPKQAQIQIETTGQTPMLSATKNKPKTPNKKTKPKTLPSDRALSGASYLRKRVVERAPNCAASRMSETQIANWAQVLDKLSKLSPEHDWATIGRTIDWLHDSDNGFVVQSAKALSNKWDAIQAARNKTTFAKPRPANPYKTFKG